jgi:hypothetical protein
MLIPTFVLLSNPTIASDSQLHRVSAGVSEEKEKVLSASKISLNAHE